MMIQIPRNLAKLAAIEGDEKINDMLIIGKSKWDTDDKRQVRELSDQRQQLSQMREDQISSLFAEI